jgi:hypothetical protein
MSRNAKVSLLGNNERAWKEHFKAVLVAEKDAAGVNECKAMGGSVGEKGVQGWAVEWRQKKGQISNISGGSRNCRMVVAPQSMQMRAISWPQPFRMG